MMKYCLIFPVFIVTILMLVGCSRVEHNSILFPTQADSDALLIVSSDYENRGSVALFGAYNLNISPDLKTIELNALRTSSVGESYLVSGMKYFMATPCSTCLKIDSITLESGDIKLTFSLTHPFKPGNLSEPPSATNRRDLDVFDVAMVVVPTGTAPSTYALGEIYAEACVRQHGFTRELESIIGDTAACPYFLVVDDSITGVKTYNKFAMGTTDKKFDVWFSDVGTYTLYLTMGYGASAKKAQRLTPSYYNPEFNRKAAWRVDVTPPEGVDPPALGNTWDDADTVTEYFVTVDVYDWQIGAIENELLINLTDVYAASEVEAVGVEIPGMTSSPVIVTVPTSGSGMLNDPLVFKIPVANTNGIPPGQYIGIVEVGDERYPPNPLVDRDYLIDFVLPSSMTNVTPPSFSFGADDVRARGSFAYTISGSASSGFRIIDISNPKAAQELGVINLSGLTCVDASTGYAYICDNDSFMVVDVSSPSTPSIVKDVSGLNVPRDVTVIGGYAYVAVAGGLVIIDIDPIASAAVIKGVSTGGEPQRMSIANGYAYLTTRLGSSGFLEIISVDPPLSAYWVSQTDIILPAGGLIGICVVNDLAYITGQRTLISHQNNLYIVDIDPPETPLTEKIIGLLELGMSIDVYQGYAYVGYPNSVDLIDVEPFQNAHREASVATPGMVYNIDVENGYIYGACQSAGLEIYTPYVPPQGGLLNYAIPGYATYQIFTATVVDG